MKSLISMLSPAADRLSMMSTASELWERRGGVTPAPVIVRREKGLQPGWRESDEERRRDGQAGPRGIRHQRSQCAGMEHRAESDEQRVGIEHPESGDDTGAQRRVDRASGEPCG